MILEKHKQRSNLIFIIWVFVVIVASIVATLYFADIRAALFITIILFLSLAFWELQKRAIENPILFDETGPLFIFFYSIYSLTQPTLALFYPRVIEYPIGMIIKAVVMCLLGLFAFIWGYNIKLGPALGKIIPSPQIRWTKLRGFAVVFIGNALLFVLFVWTVLQTGGLSNYIKLSYFEWQVQKNIQGLAPIASWYPLLGGLVLLCFSILPPHHPVTLFYLMLDVLGGLWWGIRGYLLATIMGIFVILVNKFHLKIKWAVLLPALVIGLSFNLILGSFRHIFSMYREYKITERWQEFVSREGFDFLSLLKKSEISTQFTHLLFFLDEISSGSISPQLGKAFVQDILALVPKKIWSERPESTVVWLTKQLYPQLIAPGGEVVGTIGIFIAAEAYQDFATLGVFLFLFIYGICLKAIYVWFKRAPADANRLFIYSSILYPLCVNSVRYGMVEQLRWILISPGFILIVALFGRLIWNLRGGANLYK